MQNRQAGKSLFLTLATAFAVTLFGFVAAEAKDRSKTVTFLNDITVGETVVPKGTYNVKFNSTTNEVTFQQNGRLVATTRVEVQPTTRKNPHHSTGFVELEKGRLLKTLTFQGDQRVLVIADGAGSNQNAGASAEER
jgi:preprotein translocase subunit YajC